MPSVQAPGGRQNDQSTLGDGWASLFNADGLTTSQTHATNPGDNDTSTAETIAIMGLNAHRASTSPQVIAAVRQALQGLQSPTRLEICQRVWQFAKSQVTFCEDEKITKSLWGPMLAVASGGVELLITPDRLLTMLKPTGDCDDFSQLIASMLMACKVPIQFVTVAADSKQPYVWSHVYAVARLEDGSPFPMDASHGKFAGWEVDDSRVTRKQVWPMIHGLGSSLSGLMRRGLGMFRGMGDDSTDYGTVNDNASSDSADNSLPGVYTSGVPGSSSSGINSSAVASIFGSIGNTLKSIFSPTSNPTLLPGQYYVTNPNTGQVTVQGTPQSGGINNLFSGSGGSSSLLLIGGAAVVLLLLMSGRKG